MKYVLITLTGGIIDQVTFYGDPSIATKDLAEHVKVINPEKDDAAVYGPDGLIANAKMFLDDNDQYIEGDHRISSVSVTQDKPIYVIANPHHSLGFLVVSPREPIGYVDPSLALSALEKMRKDHGAHINLYRVKLVTWPILSRKHLEQYNANRGVDDFEYALVGEYLK